MGRHGALVRAVAARHDVPAAAVGDVAEVVILALWHVLQRGEEVVRPDAWLAAVTKRVAWQWKHGEEPWREGLKAVGDGAFVAPEVSAEDLYVAMRSADLLHEIARALDPGQRAVLVGHELRGEAMKEIAASLDLRVGTAYNRLRLARAAFNKEWKRRGGR